MGDAVTDMELVRTQSIHQLSITIKLSHAEREQEVFKQEEEKKTVYSVDFQTSQSYGTEGNQTFKA